MPSLGHSASPKRNKVGLWTTTKIIFIFVGLAASMELNDTAIKPETKMESPQQGLQNAHNKFVAQNALIAETIYFSNIL